MSLPHLLADRLDQSFRFTSPGAAHGWVDMARRLAAGTPVPASDLTAETLDLCRRTSSTQWDGETVTGSIITTQPTDHQITHPGGQAWTWCIFDAMLAGLILPGPVHITTTCATTGQPLWLTINSGLITGQPDTTWVSLPSEFTADGDLRAEFCCRARMWTSPTDRDDVAWLRPDDAMHTVAVTAVLLGMIDATELPTAA
ncbi:Alkylmercury lyase [Austwickia sp. TVS 96-490-7B]|uniref:organomercurial lyase n=1 Tax=Austwickia sp. TVS 96-490-7B TaxID=2830843 RepID=UPI001C594E7F|nr:organomercurial lyase [Austwickia sp. TVS 96-490-7B]MBW3085166.1 Alkylmercury lyase [Austwickia sp. TVS 96-490-7B]